ncbi:MAG: HNH endonuclease [Acidobacteria bacterium]|nr:HNH endonuclease [Acidobacteriota bacterium]
MTRAVFGGMSDDDLLAAVKRLTAAERRAIVDLIRALIELDGRRLYLGLGCASLFVYCTRVLCLSEHAAYGRIEAARAARRYPVIIELLQSGAITLTTVTLLGSHLTEENHRGVLDEARHRSKREVELIVARLRPRPDVAPFVRKLPERPASAAAAVTAPIASILDPVAQTSTPPPAAPAASSAADRAPSGPVVKPIAPERYSMKLTIPHETHDKLVRAQALLRHVVPSGDLSAVLDRALTALLRDLERTKLASVAKPRPASRTSPHSRHIPARIRRKVWCRDDGRCAFVGAEGERCGETGFLELHHIVPFADGGEATTDNLTLRCRAHNQHEADVWFGPMVVRERAPSTEYGGALSDGYQLHLRPARPPGRQR